MNWLFPTFLAGAGLIGLPVILHFLRRRPKTTVPFPSLRFLGPTAIRDTRRHRLQRFLTLLLRCLLIGCLAAAFARPFWRTAGAARRQAMVVAVDNSMSMQAAGRWDATQEWALRQLDELRPGDQAAVLIMHPTPTWLVPMTEDLGQVRSAFQAAQPGFEKTRYAAALQVASEALAAVDARTRTLVWMADEQRVGWLGVDVNRSLPDAIRVRLAPPAPAPARQAAVVELRPLLSASAASPGGIVATVRQFTPEQDTRRIAVKVGQQTLVEQTVSLRAGDNPVELRFAAPPGCAGVRVALIEADDLPADDAAWMALATPAAGKVLLDPAPGVDFLAHALRSTERLDAGALAPAALPDGPWPASTVAVLRGSAAFRPPLLERLDQFAAAGGPVWIFVNGSDEQAAWLNGRGIQTKKRALAADGEGEHLRDWDPEHPILAAFMGQSLLPLLDVEFHGGFDLTGGTLQPIANWPDGTAAIAEWNRGRERILLAGFPLDRLATDWPAQPSFVPFVHQAARWLGAAGAAHANWHVGDAIPLPVGSGAWRTLDAEGPQPDRNVSGTVRPTAPGLYEFVAPGGSRQVFAVNAPPDESDLAPWPNMGQLAALEAKNPIPAANPAPPALGAGLPMTAATAESQQRLWWNLLALCGVFILAELALANRTAM